jgi:hypothetical protein
LRAALIWRSFGSALLLASSALADDAKRCGDDQRPWIRLATDGFSPELRSVLLVQARASLAARGFDLCLSDEESTTTPLATIRVTRAGEDVATSIAVDDGVTKKRVARDLDLRSIPPDGRAMTIALALDELLRASWAELMLADAPVKAPVPEGVREAIAAPAPAPAPPPPAPRVTWDVGAAMGGEHFGAGLDELGADVFGAYFPFSRLGLQARLGLRSGFEADGPRGTVGSTALAFALGPRVPLLPLSSRAGVDVLGEAILTRVTFAATPTAPGVRGSEKTVGAGYAALGARGWLVLVPSIRSLRAFMQVSAGVPIHTAYATDGDVRITGLAGVLLNGELGASFAF